MGGGRGGGRRRERKREGWGERGDGRENARKKERAGEARKNEGKETKKPQREHVRSLIPIPCKNQTLTSAQYLHFEGTLISALFISKQ